MNMTRTQWFDGFPVYEGWYEITHRFSYGLPLILMHYFNGQNFEVAKHGNDTYAYLQNCDDNWRGLAHKP